jgi:hypothetical protein
MAQDDRKDRTAVTYEELYDEPYSVNKLFVGFQPLYGDVFATNVTGGFGAELSYFLDNKMNFRAHFRKTYSGSFYDYNRDLAIKTSEVDNEPAIFKYFEIGGTYHAKDFEGSSKTKMFLYKKSYKGNKWAARVPLNAEVPCKVRKIYGVRLGGIAWASTVDLNRVMRKQDLTTDDFSSEEGTLTTVAATSANPTPDLFSNLTSASVYLGGSMTWIKNVAVSFDKFESGVDDLIFTAFFDLIFSPKLDLDDIVYAPRDGNGTILSPAKTYDVSAIDVKKFGFRAGIEGKFNRTLSWSYGGELGYRPTVAGSGFFAMIKLSFPVYSTNLDYKVESFGK